MNQLLGLLRICMGWIFIWPFFDKLLGFYYPTPPEMSWLAGGSPTTQFLSSLSGTFSPLFSSLAGQFWVDLLFMMGLLGIGMALILGIGMRIAAITGTMLLLLMYLSVFPTKTNPIIDSHIIYALILIVLYNYHAGRYLGFGKIWEKTKLVKSYSIFE